MPRFLQERESLGCTNPAPNCYPVHMCEANGSKPQDKPQDMTIHWESYNDVPKARGSLPIGLENDTQCYASVSGQRGREGNFSDIAIRHARRPWWALHAGGLWLLLCGLLVPALAADPPATVDPGDATSDSRLRQLMARQQPPSAADPSGGGDGVGVSALLPERQQARADLLQAGEVALARRDLTAALQAFESATYIQHGADTDTALARTYIQSGQYLRALALGAHTAGVHLDAPGGSLLYIWLLHLGGQPAMAQRLLQATQERFPGHALLALVQKQLAHAGPQANGPLLTPPTRLAPYGDSLGLPATARVVGSATLLRNGTSALVPSALLPRKGPLWLRNGLGQLAQVKLDWHPLSPDLALVALDAPLAVPNDQGVAPGDPLPGSRAYTVEYVPSTHSDPAWPVLRAGTLGQPLAVTGGGPLFDAAGRLTGVALRDGVGAKPVWIGISSLESALHPHGWTARPGPLGPVAEVDPRGRDAVYQVYEWSLKTSLQVITAASLEDGR